MKSPRLIVTWYGSLEGHGTIGDLLALRAVVLHLIEWGFDVRHITSTCASGLPISDNSFDDIDPKSVDALVFVCGPILKDHAVLRKIFNRFPSIPHLAVSVSLLQQDAINYAQPFDLVLAREGAVPRFEDVAILAPLLRNLEKSNANGLTVGLALRGRQGEYGVDRCLDEMVSDIAGAVINYLSRLTPIRIIDIEHHLVRAKCAPDNIEANYGQCDLVLTSRFHGAILALRNKIPFVALDQIRGGAKVSSLLGNTGWPHIYRADSVTADTVCDVAERLISNPEIEMLTNVARSCAEKAGETLTALRNAIEHLR